MRTTSQKTSRLAAIALVAGFVSAASGTVALGQAPSAPPGTLPSSETVRSLLMNNWADSLAIHYARQLYKSDSRLFGPYLAALHNRADWPVNQIDGATAFFHTEVLEGEQITGPERPPTLCEFSGEVKGDDAPADAGVRHSYPSIMCFNDGGILNVEYLRETERGLPIQIEKSYAMVPDQHFLVVRYTLTNNIPRENNRKVRVRFAEVVDVNNKAALDHEESAEDLIDTGINNPQPTQPINNIQAQWRPDLNAWVADMSAANGTYLVFGAFQDMDRHRVFQTVSDQIEFDRGVETEMDAVDQPDWPENVEKLTAQDVGLALWKEVVLDADSRQQYSFFYAVTSSLEEAQNAAQQARQPMTADVWFTETENAYRDWLQKGTAIDTSNAGLRSAYTRALITSKQSQQPEFGSFVAATNPAYGYKVWPRDSSVTALSFTATGHLDEAVKFYRWMASVQEDGSKQDHPIGTWYSNYSFWIRKWPKSFVEPEYDALGLFMIGVYHTWRRLNDQDPQAARDFLTAPIERLDQGPASVYEAVTRAAEFIRNNINEHGFGPADNSIWEEQLQYATFTQTTYGSGLNAAHLLALEIGDADHANSWLDGGRRILDAIHRPASASPCPGLWNDDQSRWNRATGTDCSRDDRLDSSTDLVWVFGLIDAADERALAQRNAVLSTLTPGDDDIGIARYEGDQFYFQSPVSPGGAFEASAQLPSWPQMDMYTSMLEHWRGLDDAVLQRLQWYASATNVGYMPPGEGVDWPTNRPLPSTAAEPVTAAWYVIGLLNDLNLFDPRLPPLASAADSGITSSRR
jgi:GH15 family glucan-1,4-alpha-glucosidase